MKNSTTKKLVTIAIMTSLAVVLSIVESFIPTGIPGVKLGLANIVTVVILYLYGPKEALCVELIRVFLVGLLYSGLFSQAFFLSLSGAALSSIFMFLLYLTKKFSPVSVSVAGSIGHSIGQIVLAVIILSTKEVFLYLPIILTLAIPSGFIIGYLSISILKSFRVETTRPKVPSIITISFLFLSSLISFIVLQSYTKKESEGTLAVITYQNAELMEISLSNPSKYTVIDSEKYASSIIKAPDGKPYSTIDGSTYYSFNVYNKDEKETFELTIEIKDETIRIKEETSKKHICSRTGFISNKYESLICLPNSFIVTLKDMGLDEIDVIM